MTVRASSVFLRPALIGMAVWSLGACGGDGEAPPKTVAVYYSVAVTGQAALDSIKYDDGTGALIKVPNPGPAWNKGVSFEEHGSIEAHAYVSTTGPGQVLLKVDWQTPQAIFSDSSIGVSSSATRFIVSLTHRDI